MVQVSKSPQSPRLAQLVRAHDFPWWRKVDAQRISCGATRKLRVSSSLTQGANNREVLCSIHRAGTKALSVSGE